MADGDIRYFRARVAVRETVEVDTIGARPDLFTRVAHWRAQEGWLRRDVTIEPGTAPEVVAVASVPGQPLMVLHPGEAVHLRADGTVRIGPAGELPVTAVMAMRHTGPDAVDTMVRWVARTADAKLVLPGVTLHARTVGEQCTAVLTDPHFGNGLLTLGSWLIQRPHPRQKDLCVFQVVTDAWLHADFDERR